MDEQTETAVPRLIKNTTEPMRCDWPADTFVQGGARGVVFSKDGPYRTAFVEAFPAGTFLRGQGATIEEAEQVCFTQWEQLAKCPAHPGHGPWDRRDYTNGSAFCQGCGSWFGPNMTGLSELPPPVDRERGVAERLFAGETGALVEVLEAMANVDELPERSS